MKILCTGGSGFIGTHLMDQFLANKNELLNVDIKAPQKTDQFKYWMECDILDFEKLLLVFAEFQPTHVVHLAASTSMEGKTIDDYGDNTEGTRNVLDAVKRTESVKRIIVTSSQHVRKPGSGLPDSDVDFDPLGLYGASKVIAEKITRNAELNCSWIIIRPTTIWGPYHPFLDSGVMQMIKRGIYFHPSGKPVIRSYGYVGNAVWQIEKILVAADHIVDKKIFYIGEIPIDQIDWLNAFSQALIGKNIRIVPKFLIYALTIVGDLLSVFKIKFPMYSERYRNLTTSNLIPMGLTIDTFGQPPYSLQDGVAETVSWLRSKGGIWKT